MGTTEDRYFAGLDIGGTTIKSVLVNSDGEQASDFVEVPSRVAVGYEATIVQLNDALQRLAASAGTTRDAIRAAGIDVPAANSGGVIWGRANLAQDWVGKNIQDIFADRSGMPVYVTNDGNAAALGEYMVRRKHLGSLLYVAPGTGLAGGLVMPGGKIYEGANGLALEVGHISSPFQEDDGALPPCSCGWKGCVEAWVSLVALRRRLRLELAKPEWAGHPLNGQETSIEEKAFQLRNFAAQGDALAIQLFKQQGFIFGYGIADLVRVFDPGLVVIGGGLAEASFRDQYMDWVMEGFTERAWPIYRTSPIDNETVTTRFEWATAGDSAGALGMGFAALEMFR
ncbi:MAG: ROK family protein [Rhodothermales bacterium]